MPSDHEQFFLPGDFAIVGDSSARPFPKNGIRVRTGTGAVMYTKQGFSYHGLHKWIMKMSGKY